MNTPIDNTPPSDQFAEHLASISALVDGEVESNRLLEVIDRIADTEDCRQFYRKARALSGLVAAAQPTATSRAPEHLWVAIAERAGLTEPSATGRKRARWSRSISTGLRALFSGQRGPVLATATALMALAGLTWIGLNLDSPLSETSGRGSSRASTTATGSISTEEPTIEIGSDPTMSDSRFMDLATEILQADRKYRQELLRLMSDVESMSGPAEGLSEGFRDDRSEALPATDDLDLSGLDDDTGSRVRVPRW